MQLFLVSSITILNIILWIVFFVRFKKIFSTDDIIENTRDELNRLIADVNKNTAMYINLADDRVSELKKLLAEADRKLSAVNLESFKNQSERKYSEKLNSSLSKQSQGISLQENIVNQYKKNAKIHETSAYEITSKAKRTKQAELFESKNVKNVGVTTVTSDGAAFESIPIVVPKMQISETLIVPKKDTNEQIRELYEMGKTVDEIAERLGKSTTEVQFALDMNF